MRQRRVMAFYDALCRVLLVTNLAAEQPSKVTVELTTPQYVAPNGILLCLAGEPPTLLGSGELELVLLQEGGSQFELGGSSVVDATQDAFASARNWQLSRVEATTLRSVLSTDPFYAHSYHSRRSECPSQPPPTTPRPTTEHQAVSPCNEHASLLKYMAAVTMPPPALA